MNFVPTQEIGQQLRETRSEHILSRDRARPLIYFEKYRLIATG